MRGPSEGNGRSVGDVVSSGVGPGHLAGDSALGEPPHGANPLCREFRKTTCTPRRKGRAVVASDRSRKRPWSSMIVSGEHRAPPWTHLPPTDHHVDDLLGRRPRMSMRPPRNRSPTPSQTALALSSRRSLSKACHDVRNRRATCQRCSEMVSTPKRAPTVSHEAVCTSDVVPIDSMLNPISAQSK